MNNNTTTIIVPSGNNAELATKSPRLPLRQRLKYLLSALAILAIGQVYADCTLTYDGCITATTPLLNRFGDSIDYQFGSAYAVTVTAATIPTGTIGLSNYARRKTVTYSSSGVDTSWVDFHLLGMQSRALDATFSSFGKPDSLTNCPWIKATVAENRTNAERSCAIIITMTTVTEWSGQTSTTSSGYQWKFVIKQAAGSANVTVTLDSNGGTDALPKKIFKYKNGGWLYRIGDVMAGQSTAYYSGYKQTLMDPPVGGVTDDRALQFINSWVVPTTSRPGFIFDGWYTVSTYNDANNIKISFASGEETKPSAKVEKIIAHWKFEPPQNFTVTQDLTDRVSLSWEPVANSTATYFIYRSEEEECPLEAFASTSAQQYDDMMTEPGRTYYYWIKAHGTDNGLSIESDIGEPVIGCRVLEQVAAPVITPANGETFTSSSKKVTIKCETSGATIYYTTDGSEPDETSPVCSKAFSVYDTTTIKAIAVKDGMRSSDVVIATIVKVIPATPNEALDTDIQLTTGGTGEWSGITDASAKVGGDYLKSGVISDDERTWLSLTVSGKGTFSFWWRTSCEEDDPGAADWDAAIFTAPDANQKEIRRDGIMSDWEKVSVTFATVGEHILKWTYKKDESDADGDDCLYLDGFSWTPAAPDPIVWTITFNLNGADAQDGTSPRSINDAAAIGELPTPTRAGYTFAGWWTEAEGGTEVTATTTVAADRTLFAHWTENLPPAPAYTETTPVPVRHDWLAKYSGILSAAGNDYEAAAMRPTGKKDGKGNALCVWHDYLAGTDPTNASSVFRAKVEFENGRPKVGWEPDLNEKGAKSERFYKVFGKKTLASNENWTRLADEAAQRDYNFFKVTVNMEDTPDTEEELKFGDGSGTGGNSVVDDERPATLAAPANFNASSVYRGFGIYLSWNAVDGAEEYAVYRSDSANFSGAFKVASIVSPQNWYSDEALEDFDTHYYWVRAENPTAVSSLSDCKSAAAATLGGPKNLTATEDRNDGVLLSWSAAIGATSYRVYYSNNIYAGQYVGSMTLLGETDGLEFLDTTIAAGEVRMYKILSLGERSDDWGSCSAVAGARASGSPQAPSVQISSSSYSVYLYWGPVAGATGYEVYRGTANNPAVAEKIATVTSEGLSTSYSNLDTPPVAGKNYYYWVRTVYADKTSGFSVAVTGGLKVQMPTGIVVSTDKSDGVLVSWNVVEGATSYIVYGKRVGIDSDYVELGSTDATTWLDTTVSQGKFSRYGVAAVSETGTTAIGDASEYGYRAKKVVSVVLTGTDEATIDPYSGATLNFKCTATYADGTTEDVAADLWDYSELAGEMWMSEQTFYVRLGNAYLEGELTSKQLTMRASYTANAGDANPTVYNLSHKVVVHPAE